jgi:hypothetical protein
MRGRARFEADASRTRVGFGDACGNRDLAAGNDGLREFLAALV